MREYRRIHLVGVEEVVSVGVKMLVAKKGAGERRQDARLKRRDKQGWRGSSWKLKNAGNGKRLHD